jgi:molecular chaperone DnaJ
MGTNKTHYQVLGVSAEASIDEIRRAYRERMRAVHPDINENSTNDSQQMTELNDAWKTLSSPQLRRAYDSSVFVSNSSLVNSGLRNTEPVISYAPARFPWRGLLIACLVGAILVLVAHAMTTSSAPRPVDQLLSSGSCVNIDSSLSAVEVSCAEPHDAVVEQLIAFDRSCPLEMGRFKDRQGMGVACVLPARPVPGQLLPGVNG